MLGIGIDTSIASANEVSDAIAKQDAKPASKPAAKAASKPAAKGNGEKTLMDNSINFIKSSSNKQEAYDQVIKKYGSEFTEKQLETIQKFVR